MTFGHLALLEVVLLWVSATQYWSWIQPHFEPRVPRITLRIGNPPGGLK